MNQTRIVKGSYRVLIVRLELTNGDPYDLSTATQITARFQRQDNTILQKNLSSGVSILSAGGGKIQINLTEIDTASLMVGNAMSFEIDIDVNTVRTIVLANQSLQVVNRLQG